MANRKKKRSNKSRHHNSTKNQKTSATKHESHSLSQETDQETNLKNLSQWTIETPLSSKQAFQPPPILQHDLERVKSTQEMSSKQQILQKLPNPNQESLISSQETLYKPTLVPQTPIQTLHATAPHKILKIDAHAGGVNDIAFAQPNKQLCIVTCEDDELIEKWIKPPFGYKVNTDGSTRDKYSTGGGVIRDQYGNWVMGFSFKVSYVFSCTAELLAINEGLRCALQYKDCGIFLESDAQSLVEKIKEKKPNGHKPSIRSEMKTALELLEEIGEKISIEWISRCQNKVADKLAAFGYTLKVGERLFLSTPPPCAADLVEMERMD